MKKLFIRLLIVLVILVVLAVLAVGLFLDGAIKKGVETFGPQIAKVDIKLASVNLSILSGSGKLRDLVVGNPEGYKTPNAIKVGTASIAVVPGSVLSDKIVIKSIRVEAPEITYEGGLLGGDNLHKILDNVTAAVGSGTVATNASGKPAKKLQVDDFLIAGAKVNVSLKGTGGFAAPITIPDIHLTSLGQGPISANVFWHWREIGFLGLFVCVATQPIPAPPPASFSASRGAKALAQWLV